MARRARPLRREPVRGPSYAYTAVFEPAPEGGYTVTVPALPGLVTEGETLEEARRMVADAIVGYLESLRREGETIPPEREAPRTERVTVTLSPE